MKKTLTTLTLATLALFGAQAAMAQDKTRAEVKKETAEANKAGNIASGDAPAQKAPISAKSDVPRAEVKKETAAANKAGQIPGTGVGDSPNAAGTVSPKAVAATSTTTRAERKATTAEANKAGAIPGTGVGESADITKKK